MVPKGRFWLKVSLAETFTFPAPGLQLLTFRYIKADNFACFDFDFTGLKERP
jgi:hypothetical protein